MQEKPHKNVAQLIFFVDPVTVIIRGLEVHLILSTSDYIREALETCFLQGADAISNFMILSCDGAASGRGVVLIRPSSGCPW